MEDEVKEGDSMGDEDDHIGTLSIPSIPYMINTAMIELGFELVRVVHTYCCCCSKESQFSTHDHTSSPFPQQHNPIVLSTHQPSCMDITRLSYTYTVEQVASPSSSLSSPSPTQQQPPSTATAIVHIVTCPMPDNTYSIAGTLDPVPPSPPARFSSPTSSSPTPTSPTPPPTRTATIHYPPVPDAATVQTAWRVLKDGVALPLVADVCTRLGVECPVGLLALTEELLELCLKHVQVWGCIFGFLLGGCRMGLCLVGVYVYVCVVVCVFSCVYQCIHMCVYVASMVSSQRHSSQCHSSQCHSSQCHSSQCHSPHPSHETLHGVHVCAQPCNVHVQAMCCGPHCLWRSLGNVSSKMQWRMLCVWDGHDALYNGMVDCGGEQMYVRCAVCSMWFLWSSIRWTHTPIKQTKNNNTPGGGPGSECCVPGSDSHTPGFPPCMVEGASGAVGGVICAHRVL